MYIKLSALQHIAFKRRGGGTLRQPAYYAVRRSLLTAYFVHRFLRRMFLCCCVGSSSRISTTFVQHALSNVAVPSRWQGENFGVLRGTDSLSSSLRCMLGGCSNSEPVPEASTHGALGHRSSRQQEQQQRYWRHRKRNRWQAVKIASTADNSALQYSSAGGRFSVSCV